MNKSILLLFFIFYFNSEISGQNYLDFGFGKDTINQLLNTDSIFTFNSLHHVDTNFKINTYPKLIPKNTNKLIINSSLYFTFRKNSNNLNYLYFNNKRISVKKLFNDNEFYHHIELEDIYTINLHKINYWILILRCKTSNSRLSKYRGVVLGSTLIYKFPDYQSTNSPLNLGDFNCDGKLDYASFNPIDSKGNTNIQFYEFDEDTGFKLNNLFLISLLPLDGYIYRIDYENSRIPACNR
jgi:hypothetical protein